MMSILSVLSACHTLRRVFDSKEERAGYSHSLTHHHAWSDKVYIINYLSARVRGAGLGRNASKPDFDVRGSRPVRY